MRPVFPARAHIRFLSASHTDCRKSCGILSDILCISPDILSGISSDILSGISPGILSDILSNISSHAFSDILSGIRSGISSDILSHILSGISPGILSGILSDILTVFLTFFLTYLLTFFLRFVPTYLLTLFLTFCLAYLLTFCLTFCLTFFLTFLLTFFLTFFLAYLLTFCLTFSDISSDILSHILADVLSDISSVILSDIPSCTSSDILSGISSDFFSAGWGPAANTGRKWSRLRSGREHWQWGSRLTRRRRRRRRRRMRMRRSRRWTDIKSNNPHLTGGENTQFHRDYDEFWMHTLSSSSWSSIIYTSSVNGYRPPRLEEKGILDVAICRVPSHLLDFNISPLNIVLKAESLKFNFPMVKHFVVLTPKPRGHSGLTPKNPNAFTFWHSGRVQSQNGRAGITVFSQQKHAAKTTTSVTLWTDLYKGCFSAGANAILFIKSLKGICNIPLTYTSWMFLCLQYLYRVWKRNHQEQQRHPSNGCIPASKRQNLPSSHAIHCAKMRSSRKWTKVRSLRKIRWRNERNENCWSNVPSNRIHVIKLVPQWQLFLNHFSSRLHINFNGLLMERRFWVYIYLSIINM